MAAVPEPLRTFLETRLMYAPGYVVPFHHVYSAWRGVLRGHERQQYSRDWFRQATRTMLSGVDPQTGRQVFANVAWRTEDWLPQLRPLVRWGRYLRERRRTLRELLTAADSGD